MVIHMADTEKITLNIPVVDLGQIDLLVEQGFYSNRTDFLKTAVRNHLNSHSEEVRQTITKKSYVLGVTHYSMNSLARVQEEGYKLDIKTLGMLVIADDVPIDLALSTINSITVHGVFRASNELKRALGDRIKSNN